MNNYKLIENRPELTSSQIVAGMNFAVVQASALALTAGAIGGKAVGVGLITKGFFAVLAVTAGLAVYKSYNASKEDSTAYTVVRDNDDVIHRDKSKGPLLIMETISPKQNEEQEITPNAVCQSHNEQNNGTGFKGPDIPLVNIDSLNKLEEAPFTGTKIPEPKTEMQTVASAIKIQDDFKPSPNAECVLWKPSSFCIPPVEKATDIGMSCGGKGCEFDFVNCESLDKKGYSAVRLRVTKKRGKFRVTSYLKNIVLIRGSETQCIATNPVAASFSANYDNTKGQSWTYQGNKLKADILNITFTDYIDIYLIFKEDIKTGDKIIIEDFIMAKVTE